MTSMTVSTRLFVNSHGKKPRGHGSWAFLVMDADEAVVFTPAMNFSDAKVWVKAHVRENFPGCTDLEVGP